MILAARSELEVASKVSEASDQERRLVHRRALGARRDSWELVSTGVCRVDSRLTRSQMPGRGGRCDDRQMLWRRREGRLEVLLAHQGRTFLGNKDIGHWTIPKGEAEPGEELVTVARREFGGRNRTGSAQHAADRAWADHTEVGQAGAGLGGRGRPRPVDGREQHLRDGMARALRRRANIPRDRSRRMVRSRSGAAKAEGGASSLPRSAAAGPCLHP